MSVINSRGQSPGDVLRPLRRTRQYRDFTDEPMTEDQLDAILDVARWSGSSRNSQPWRFMLTSDTATIQAVAAAGVPQTRSLQTARVVIAIMMPDDADEAVSHAYDEGRVAERILIAASMLGLGAGIAWVRTDVRDQIQSLLAVPRDRLLRTIVAVGHPSEAALRPKSAPGQARLSREEIILG